MAKTRALLTETEREQIAGEHGETRKSGGFPYQESYP